MRKKKENLQSKQLFDICVFISCVIEDLWREGAVDMGIDLPPDQWNEVHWKGHKTTGKKAE
jgi:hypothetical protein